MDLVAALSDAIARFEGFYKPGSLAQRNNNPGNLRTWGSYPVVDGYARFPNAETGWAALREQVHKNINRGLNLHEFFAGKSGVYAGYAPAADRNPVANYVAYVSAAAGIPSNVPLVDLVGDAAGLSLTDGPALITSSGTELLNVARSALDAADPKVWIALAVAAGASLFLWMDSQ